MFKQFKRHGEWGCIKQVVTLLKNGQLLRICHYGRLLELWELNKVFNRVDFIAPPTEIAPLELRNGEVVTSTLNGSIFFINLLNEQNVTVGGHTMIVRLLVELNNGNFVSGSDDKQIKVWNVTLKQCIATLMGHDGNITALIELKNGNLVSGCTTGTIIIWDMKSFEVISKLTDHSERITSLVELQNGNLVSGSYDKKINVWDMEKKSLIKTLTGHTGPINSVKLLQTGDVISCSDDGTIKVWNISVNACISTLTSDDDPSAVKTLVELKNGDVISGSAYGTIIVWDIKKETINAKLKGYVNYTITALIEQPNENIISVSDREFVLWEKNKNWK